MDKRRPNLPSLGALAVFDAAARHMNFTAAAREMNVTQAAVSKRIKVLEQELGVSPSQPTQDLYDNIQIDNLVQISFQAPLLSYTSRYDWYEAPEINYFYGRNDHLHLLQQWTLEGCRLMMILGIGGVGKTALAAKWVQTIAGSEIFERIIWRSLINAPLLTELLQNIIRTLSTPAPPPSQPILIKHYKYF